MRKIITLLALFISAVGFAQTGSITGWVEDGSGKPVSAATVNIYKADSSLVKIGAADKAGQYRFDGIAAGKYFLAITAVGFQKQFVPAFEINSGNPSIDLKITSLVQIEKSMAGVTVTTRKPLVEQKLDRTIINVDASITNAGSTALEVLEKSPGVSVDKDGNISLKGKEGVMVLVDGRPTQLSAADLANMLRTMQASQLDQVEIMTNPPARFDAAGNAGVINIKTKKNRVMGYSGSVSATLGHGKHFRSNEALSLAYRHNKVNIFGNFSHNLWKGTEDLRLQRNFLHQSTKELLYNFDQKADLTNNRTSLNGKIGIDYSVNDKTTIGAVVSGYSGPGTFEGNTVTNKLEHGNFVERTTSNSLTKETFKNLNTNLNFRRVLDTMGTEITADLDYVTYNGGTNLNLFNSYEDAAGHALRKRDSLNGNLPQEIVIRSGKVDFTRPMKNGARFDAGLKTSIVSTDNNAIYDTVHMGAVIRDLGRSNHYVYNENINAAYVNFSTPLSKKFSIQLGLRVEHTHSDGTSKGFRYDMDEDTFKPFDTTFRNNYVQLFPTAYFQYKAGEHHSFVMNYGRRIRRPNYENLNPFIEFIDRYTYQQGNPDLKPQFSHNVELSHSFKGFLTTTLNYSVTTDIIQRIVDQNEAKSETFLRQANIARQEQYGISVSANKAITKWWTSNVYVNVFHNQFEGEISGNRVDLSSTVLMLNGSQQFKVGKNTTTEINGWYRTKGVDGVMVIKPVGMISLGLSQQVLQGKGTLRLTVRDVFSTQHFQGNSKYGAVDLSFQNYNDSRSVSVGFTYRFNKGKVAGPRKRNSSAADELNRAGIGGN